VRAVRLLTILWPGLPWLWLRGSLTGLVLALAFAVVLDAAVVVTWIWNELVELPVAIGIWTAAAAIFVASTASAIQSFPPPLVLGRDAAADAMFVAARDAYLARDWTTAEAGLRTLLARFPTDGEAQLLLATLLRRVGRGAEARVALEQLSHADSGAAWRTAIARELDRLDADAHDADPDSAPVALPLPDMADTSASRGAAA